MAYALSIALGLLVAGSQLVTNPEDMARSFGRAQRLMAGGDFDGARDLYVRLAAIPDRPLLRASQVRVVVDEQEVDLQDAARYQLANMSRRMAHLQRREADLAAQREADSLRNEMRANLREAARRSTRLRDEEGFELRERAGYLAVDCLYEAGEYEGAVEAGQRQLDLFPAGGYAAAARYTLGWAYFRLERFEEAVSAFRAYAARDSTGIRVERARLQTGLALEELHRYEEALAAFSELAGRYDPASMSFEEKTSAALAGLREGHSRRSVAAKAWIKRGDLLQRLGRVEEAARAYEKVCNAFSDETHLAEQAWIRRALAAWETAGREAALALYRRASERIDRPAFRARMQAGLMSLLFEEGRYEEALDGHRLYLQEYSPHADEAGVSLAEAQFRVGECLRLLAGAAAEDSASVLLKAAIGAYGEVPEESPLAGEALFWQGHAYQAMGQVDSARVRYERVAGGARGDLACRAVLRWARVAGEGEAVLYRRILEECEDAGTRAFAALMLGHRYRVEGRIPEAQELLASVPADQPQFAQARIELAQILVRQGRRREALAALSRLQDKVTAISERARVWAQMGLLFQQQQEHARALELLRAALPHLESDMRAAARFGIGWSLLRQEAYEDAWQVWMRALEEGSLDEERQATVVRGLGMCARALEEPERMVAYYERLLKEEETRDKGRIGLTRFYLDSGQPQEVRGQVGHLVGAADRETALQAQLLLGRALAAQDSLETARQVLEQGLARQPPPELVAEYHYHLGSAALGLRQYREAEQAFARAFAQAAGRSLKASALFCRGHGLKALGRFAEARACFLQTAESFADHPQAPEAAFILGEMAFEEEQVETARSYYEKVFSRWPGSRAAPEALYGAAWCALERGDEEVMERFFRRLSTDYSGHVRAAEGMMHLGDYYYNDGRYSEAQRFYGEVRQRFPDRPQAGEAKRLLAYLSDVEADSLYRKAMAFFDEGEYERAIEQLRHTIEEYEGTPSEAAARCNLAVAYQRMWDWPRALEACEEAITALDGRKEEGRALEFALENRAWIRRHLSEEVQ